MKLSICFFHWMYPHILLPEIKLHKSIDYNAIANLAELGIIPTKWGTQLTYGNIYTGGAHLSRFILDNPEEFRGKNIADIGSGSGVVAIALKMAGAKHVTALDRDEIAVEFIRRNAAANNTDISIQRINALDADYRGFDIITAADVFVDQSWQVQKMLKEQAGNGIRVFAASGNFPIELLMEQSEPLHPSAAAQKMYVRPEVFIKLPGLS